MDKIMELRVGDCDGCFNQTGETHTSAYRPSYSSFDSMYSGLFVYLTSMNFIGIVSNCTAVRGGRLCLPQKLALVWKTVKSPKTP